MLQTSTKAQYFLTVVLIKCLEEVFPRFTSSIKWGDLERLYSVNLIYQREYPDGLFDPEKYLFTLDLIFVSHC